MSDTSEARPQAVRRTVVEEGTLLKGALASSCPVVVMGRVEGELSGPAIEVTETGRLVGRATITELRSRGELEGEFVAETVELSGSVRAGSSIRAGSLEVSPGGDPDTLALRLGASCVLEIGDAPEKAKAVADALAAAAPARASGAGAPGAETPAAAASEAARGNERDVPAGAEAERAPETSSLAAERGGRESGGRRGKRGAKSEPAVDDGAE